MNHDVAVDYLAHYGKLGMKWGRRRTSAEIQIHKQDRARLRGLDKKARAQDARAEARKTQKGYNDVQAARARAGRLARFTNGAIIGKKAPNSAMLIQAKAKYKIEREQVGKVVAGRALAKAYNKVYKDIELSQKAANKREEILNTVADILEVAAVIVK